MRRTAVAAGRQRMWVRLGARRSVGQALPTKRGSHVSRLGQSGLAWMGRGRTSCMGHVGASSVVLWWSVDVGWS